MKKIFVVFALFFFTSLMIQAQSTYYSDPSGSDATGNGSLGNPWKSLYKACSTVKTPGDVIHVNAGTYLETVQSILSVGVSIEGEGVTSIVKSHVAATATILLSSTTQGTNGNQVISFIKMDGDALIGYKAIQVNSRNNVSIHDCTFLNFNHEGIVFTGGLTGANTADPTGFALNNTFYNNSIINCAGYPGGGGYGNLHISGQEGMLIYNNTITATGRARGKNGVCIKNVSESGWTKGMKIYGNTLITDQTLGYDVTDAYNFAIELWSGQGTEIYNNNIYGTVDIGGYIRNKGIYPYSISVHNNFIGSIHPTSVYLKAFDLEPTIICDEVLIYNNLIKNVNKGINFLPTNSAKYSNVKVYYNIFDQIGHDEKGWGTNPSYGFSSGHGTASSISNFFFYNNVFNMSTYSGALQANAIEIPCKAGVALSYFYIQNNIIIGCDAPLIESEVTGTIDHLWITNNIFYGNAYSNKPTFHITPTHYVNENNVISNPMFVSLTDFHLKSGSPAINAGFKVGLTTDYVGTPLIGLPDIGAYEFMTGDNQHPAIQDQGFQLNQNSPDGTAVGTVMATDQNAGQALAFTIVSGNTNGTFAINALTGVLFVANSASLNADFALMVRVQDNGLGELSSQATISINVISTGIELIVNKATIKVYPNPVSDELTIEFEGNEDRISFDILNSTGQIVFEGNLREKTVVQTTNFSPGFYTIKIEDGKTYEYKKIIKV